MAMLVCGAAGLARRVFSCGVKKKKNGVAASTLAAQRRALINGRALERSNGLAGAAPRLRMTQDCAGLLLCDDSGSAGRPLSRRPKRAGDRSRSPGQR